jgi:hypothetical protein
MEGEVMGVWLPRAVAIVAGGAFIAIGAWAMVDPSSFFATVAMFEPYNQHFVQDIGAFQIGLGAVLLLGSASPRPDGLVVALLGVGVGATCHLVSHLIGRDLGGTPERDIPLFGAMAVVLVAAGAWRWNAARGVAGPGGAA